MSRTVSSPARTPFKVDADPTMKLHEIDVEVEIDIGDETQYVQRPPLPRRR